MGWMKLKGFSSEDERGRSKWLWIRRMKKREERTIVTIIKMVLQVGVFLFYIRDYRG